MLLLLPHSELHYRRRLFKRECEEEIFILLEDGNSSILAFLPKATVYMGDKKLALDAVLARKSDSIKTWTSAVLDSAISICQSNTYPSRSPEAIMVSEQISRIIVRSLLNILSYNRSLTDKDYYFIGNVGSATGLPSEKVSVIIEQILYRIRKEFFQLLTRYLTVEDCHRCAVLLYKAIHADDFVHPAEYTYFENISQLVRNDQKALEKVKREGRVSSVHQDLSLNEEFSGYFYCYLVEVVMCNGQVDPKESAFVREVGNALGFDKKEQDAIIQPIALSMTAKAALFPQKGKIGCANHPLMAHESNDG